MTLSDVATFSTALSSVAVTASLIYLALQTHQNARHTRALIHQGRITALRDIFLARTNADLAAAMIVATGGAPTPREVQQQQYSALCGAMIYGWQDTYSQYRIGLLEDDFFRQMRFTAESMMTVPAFRAAWETYKVPGTHFAAFMDGVAEARR